MFHGMGPDNLGSWCIDHVDRITVICGLFYNYT